MKRALNIVTVFVMVLLFMFVPGQTAYAANISLKTNSSSVEIGKTVTATISVPDNISGTLYLTFPTDVLEFSKASAEVNVNGGAINISIGKYGLAASQSVTITFKTKTSGTAKLTAKAVELYDHNELEGVSLGDASTSIAVENKVVEPSEPTESESQQPTENEKSPNNSLKSLKLSAGTLSPKFKYNITKYTATVDYEVDKVIVSAKATHAKAVIESVTGNGTVPLKVGENKIEIVVRAENGVKAVYRITVTRKPKETVNPSESESTNPSESESQNPSESQQPSENPVLKEILQWNGEQLHLEEQIPADKIPADFQRETILIGSQEIPALSFANGDMKLLYLLNKNNAGTLYVYDEEQQMIYPFIRFSSEKGYVIVQQTNEADAPGGDNWYSCTLSVEGKGVIQAYQQEEESDFYLIYGMNNQGGEGWYIFDSVEQTYQRYSNIVREEEDDEDIQTGIVGNETNKDKAELMQNYKELRAELDKAKTIQYIMMAVAALLILVIIILVVILLQKRNMEDVLDDFEIYDSEDEKDNLIDRSFAYENEFKPGKKNTIDNAAFATAIAKEKGFVEEEKEAEVKEVFVEKDVESEDEIEIEFYEMPVEEFADEVSETEDEIEIEFYEMPVEESADEVVETDDEIEIEFYEMPVEESADEVVENEDEIEIEFYEMPVEEQEEISAGNPVETEPEYDEREAEEAAAVQAIFNGYNPKDSYDEEDEDLKFIDL